MTPISPTDPAPDPAVSPASRSVEDGAWLGFRTPQRQKPWHSRVLDRLRAESGLH